VGSFINTPDPPPTSRRRQHAAGNLLFFAGPSVYNAYSAKLHASPLIRGVEYYLALAAVGHSVSGAYLTLKFRNLAPPPDGKASSWFVRARLALTGTLISAFVVKHLLDLRFRDGARAGAGAGAGAGAERDMYADILSTLKDARVAALYAAASAVVGAHLAWGWEKAVKKIKVGPADKALANADAVAAVGQGVAALATGVFVAVAAAAWAKANEQ
jgi:hypothetical protein